MSASLPHANGFPKAGNHALVKAMQLLGIPAQVNHAPHRELLGQVVFVARDPRAVLASWVRFKGHPLTPGMLLTHLRCWHGNGSGGDYFGHLAQFARWLSPDADTLVVRYEDLLTSSEPMRRIAEFAGVPYLEGAWESLPGQTATWGVPVDWRAAWTNDVQQAWDRAGGSRVLTDWGY